MKDRCQYFIERRKKRKAARICERCPEPAAKGHVHCAECLALMVAKKPRAAKT